MFDLSTLTKELGNEDKSDHLIKTAFSLVIKEIKETKSDEKHFETIGTYIQSVDHQFFNPLYEYSLWIIKQDYNAALEAAAKFHENAINAAKEKMYLLSVLNFEIAIDIYKSLGKRHLNNVKDVIKDIFEIIKMIESKNDFRWNLEFLELLYNNWDNLVSENREEISSIIERGYQHFENAKKMDLAIHYLEMKRKTVNKNGEAEEVKNILERIAQAYETKAELRKEEPAVVCAFLEDALGYYEKARNKSKINEIRVKLKDISKKIEYSEVSVESELPIEWIEAFIDNLKLLNINEIPLHIGATKTFVPKRKDVRKFAAGILRDYPLVGYLPKVTVSDGNSVKSSHSEEELLEYQYRHQYSFEIQYTGLILSVLFQKLIEEELFCSESVYNYLSGNELFSSDDLKIAKAGFDAYFKTDYVSSIYILVPKLENAIRFFMHKVRISTTISDKDGIREGDLGSYLRKQEVEDMFGCDFNDFLKILLIEKDAINLRNRLAHGLLDDTELDKTLASLIIFVYLRLGTSKLNKK